ncbi:transposase [Vulgatibacter sp.]|uniref:transposase n=1 Tax=Vulgatibacter sp. TaxID=1971226 RepID=UPI00356AAA7D
MRRKQKKHEASSPSSAPETGTELDTTSNSPDVRRGRPGRRGAEDRREAVLQLLAGKASVDPLAMRYGVYPSTIESWRDEALAGIEKMIERGSSKRAREAELEQEKELLTRCRSLETWRSTEPISTCATVLTTSGHYTPVFGATPFQDEDVRS